MARERMDMRHLAWPLLSALCACTGNISDQGGTLSGSNAAGSGNGVEAAPEFGNPELPAQNLAATGGLRRLTVSEYDNTVRDLLGDESRPSALLFPEDLKTPFDNDYTHQVASKALVEGAELLAQDIARRWLEDPQRRARAVGCNPSGADDATCFRQFLTDFGRRAFRRPLTEAELDRYMSLLEYGVEQDNFDVAVETALRAFLQDPQFLYRVEIGTPTADDPTLHRLNGYEVLTRLSYLLWGSTPDATLLDAAETLNTHDAISSTVHDMLLDSRARERVARFHALWLGYDSLPHPAELSTAMKAESAALIERVVFDEQRPWQDLFRLTETFVPQSLAEHYGLSGPGTQTPGWVSYADSGRQGLLSHGTFLSVGGKFSDTSPTLRGLAIRTRLFCQDVPPPPPNVDVDAVVEGTEEAKCKEDRYQVHAQGGCASCHALMDPVGFGLERYDQMGRYRTHETEEPSCEIRGVGELVGIGQFSGPAELSNLMLSSGLINECVMTQLYRFAIGRYELDDIDRQLVTGLVSQVGANDADFRFDDLLVSLTASEAFSYRREEP